MITDNLTERAIKFHFKQIYSKKGDRVEWFVGNRKKIQIKDFSFKELRDLFQRLKKFSIKGKKENIVIHNWKRIIKRELKKRKQK